MPRITCSFDWMGLNNGKLPPRSMLDTNAEHGLVLKLGLGKHDDELVPFIQPERVSTATVFAEKSYIFEYKWGQFENEVLGLEGIIENDPGNVINPS